MNGRITFVVLMGAVAAVLAGVAAGKNPPSGSSTGTGTVFLPNQVTRVTKWPSGSVQ